MKKLLSLILAALMIFAVSASFAEEPPIAQTVTLEPPTPDIESGSAVPFGTVVTLKRYDGNKYTYSKSDEASPYNLCWFDKQFIITGDTIIKASSVYERVKPDGTYDFDTEYITPEAEYKYSVLPQTEPAIYAVQNLNPNPAPSCPDNASVMISAVFGGGADNKTFENAEWFRVPLLDGNADPSALYEQNKDRAETVKIKTDESGINRCEIPASLNGTYIISAVANPGGERLFTRCDVTQVAHERPRMSMNFDLTGDFSADVIGTAKIHVLDAGDSYDIKSITFAKGYMLLPGSEVGSLPPQYRDEQYDISESRIRDLFVRSGLEIRPDENGVYNIKYPGVYYAFVENTGGGISTLIARTPGYDEFDFTGPKIEYEITKPKTDSEPAEVKVDISDSSGIARTEYADIVTKPIGPSHNGTDEFYLADSPTKIENGTITTYRSVIVRAVNTYGKSSFERIEIPEVPADATPEPSSTEAPDIDYLYEIGGLSILTLSGEALEAPPENGSFEAEVTLKKLKDESSKDYIFVAAYSEDGMLLDLDYVRADFAPDYDYSFGFNIPAQAQKIGSIKAFVWSNFNSAESLAEPKELTFAN